MKIAIGSDHAGLAMKESLTTWLRENGREFEDFGTFSPEPVDYPDIAQKVAEAVTSGRFERGVLICGTGIGMSIAANKVPGVRAAQCSDPLAARLSRQHNDANVLTFSGRLLGPEMGKEICRAWLEAEFEGGRHAERVHKIQKLENRSCLQALGER